jgi:hypothetical protein
MRQANQLNRSVASSGFKAGMRHEYKTAKTQCHGINSFVSLRLV